MSPCLEATCVSGKKSRAQEQRQSCLSGSLPTFEPLFWEQKCLNKPLCNQKRGECSFVVRHRQSNRALPTAVFWKLLGFLRHSLIKTYHKYLLSRGFFSMVAIFFLKFKHNGNPIFTSLEGKTELLKSCSCVQRARPPGFHHCTSGAEPQKSVSGGGSEIWKTFDAARSAAICGICGSKVCAPLQVLLLSK